MLECLRVQNLISSLWKNIWNKKEVVVLHILKRNIELSNTTGRTVFIRLLNMAREVMLFNETTGLPVNLLCYWIQEGVEPTHKALMIDSMSWRH